MLLLIILMFAAVNSQPCGPENSVDITDGELLEDDIIQKNGKKFNQDNVYHRNVSGVLKTFGCKCMTGQCFRKCCPLNQVYSLNSRGCEEQPRDDIIARNGLDLYNLRGFETNVNASKFFNLLYGKPCQGVYMEDDGEWFLQEDGQLYAEVANSIPSWTLRGPDKYCIDTFVTVDPVTGNKTSRLDALVCFQEETVDKHSKYLLSSSCMLISCVFILATLAVYAWLPELRNLHGRVLMVYLLCFFFGFLFFATMQIMLITVTATEDVCFVLTILIYFFLVSGFFWLNVMCFDIWWTFSGKRGHSARMRSIKARFIMYCLYAFGWSTMLSILLVSLEMSGVSHPLMPRIKVQGCFLYGTSRLIYLYGPMIILCVANIIFFTLTALKIAEIKKQTSVLNSQDNSMHDTHRGDRQRLVLYVKLFMVMGINWIMEIASALYPEATYIWKFTDTYNVLLGPIIFVIFVCKRKIFRLIKRRIKERFEHESPRDSIGELKDLGARNKRREQLNGMRSSQETIRTTLGSDSDFQKIAHKEPDEEHKQKQMNNAISE